MVCKADNSVKRVVGVFQARGTSSSTNAVALKVALVGTAGAPHTLLPLAEALDGEKWAVWVHFCSGTFRMGADIAEVKNTVAEGGNITKVVAVLTMAGQPPMPEGEYELEAFIASWLDPPREGGADEERRVALGTGGDDAADALDVSVEDPEVEVELGAWPAILAHVRIMERLDLTVTSLKREDLVPWVAAALRMQWKGPDRAKLGDEELVIALDKLEKQLGDKSSPNKNRLKRYAAIKAIGDSPGEHGRTLGRLYLDGAAERADRERRTIDVDKEGSQTGSADKAKKKRKKKGRDKRRDRDASE